MSDKLVRIKNRYDTFDNVKNEVLSKGEIVFIHLTGSTPKMVVGDDISTVRSLDSLGSNSSAVLKYHAGRKII